ncbi:bifunctional pyr operon transcriptional regulator/uracil phosphoribosyltransferase PyrR [Sandaracinus amylolyticus]|uniref:bifunctional pyr operon transcriptional regulator/uracil phosphoribosyltransferase PyrR n=1 Tax=Sandaracinus amylolyticus TaxID=927083 RepID=UPI001F0221A1|nr:bifunctional pyr operon transcriptional regulator/uracil phosphoribosyltransferase PyrR [Sandaracinus amylolyticus]UJR80096.1 Bifunctional pyr operon transcriptional regulator/uracil phosphoribosyltransferase PyrR [Sandaracinus amylolyticus]
MQPGETVMDAESIARTVRRLAHEIVEHAGGTERLALVGVRRGGVPIAERLARAIEEAEKQVVPVGSVEIALYRDDAATALPDPKIGPSRIDFDVTGREVVLVDDVMQTGRTIRAAIDCLLDYGRPRRVWLAVLLDRGGRELPIAPDFVGRVVQVPGGARLEVKLDDVGFERAICVRSATT